MKHLLLILIASYTWFSHAQWQPDVRLTNSQGNSSPSAVGKNIASNGNIIQIVWTDERHGYLNDEVYYKRSNDGGITWGPDIRFTNNTSLSYDPSICVSGTTTHIVWVESTVGYFFEIYYKRSTDTGINWSNNIRLIDDTLLSVDPSISVFNQNVYIVWMDTRSGNSEIYYKRSTDEGLTWGSDMRLTNNQAVSERPKIALFNQFVHVVWYDNRDGNREIYYKRSTDMGINWGQDIRLTNDPAYSYTSTIAADQDFVCVVWYDERDGNFEVYTKYSTNGGVSWTPDNRITNNPYDSRYPNMVLSNQVIHITWNDERDGNLEVYYKRSTNRGNNWDPDLRLTNNDSLWSLYPSISVSGNVVHILWADDRDGDQEVYYKRNPTGNSIGIINISNEIPKEFSLSQNYPNPFNPTTHFEFQIPKSGLVKLQIFDALGREITTLVNESLAPGTYKADWDASNYPSGVYFYKLMAGEYTETRKMVLLK